MQSLGDKVLPHTSQMCQLLFQLDHVYCHVSDRPVAEHAQELHPRDSPRGNHSVSGCSTDEASANFYKYMVYQLTLAKLRDNWYPGRHIPQVVPMHADYHVSFLLEGLV